MPVPTLPVNPTPAQVSEFVNQVGESIVSSINSAATSSETTLREGTAAAVAQLTKIAEAAQAGIEESAERARRDVFELLNQINRSLGGAVQDALALGTVNNEKFIEPLGCFVLVAAAVNSGAQKIVIESREPSLVAAFQGLAASTASELRSKVREKLLQKIPNINVQIQQAVGADDVAMVLAISTLVLAVGVTIFVICVGLALLYALSRNYDITGISMEWTGSGPKLRIESIKR